MKAIEGLCAAKSKILCRTQFIAQPSDGCARDQRAHAPILRGRTKHRAATQTVAEERDAFGIHVRLRDDEIERALQIFDQTFFGNKPAHPIALTMSAKINGQGNVAAFRKFFRIAAEFLMGGR